MKKRTARPPVPRARRSPSSAARSRVLRTPLGGADRICALAAARVERATGLELAVSALPDPAARARARGGGRPARPRRGARSSRRTRVAARLAPVQALGRHGSRLERARARAPAARARAAPGAPAGGGGGPCCPPRDALALRGPRARRRGRRARRRAPRRSAASSSTGSTSAPARRRADAPGARARPSGARASRSPRRRSRRRGRRAARCVASAASVDAELALDLSSARGRARRGARSAGVRARRARARIARALRAPRSSSPLTRGGPRRGRARARRRHRATRSGRGGRRRGARSSGAARRRACAATVALAGARVRRVQRAGDGQPRLRLAARRRSSSSGSSSPLAGGAVLARGTVRLARGAAGRGRGGARAASTSRRCSIGSACATPWVTPAARRPRGGSTGTLCAAARSRGDARGRPRATCARSRARTAPATRRPRASSRSRAAGSSRRSAWTATGSYFDGGPRLGAAAGTFTADAAVHFSTASAASRSARRGEADLDALGRVGEVPWAGLATLDATCAAAPYGNPRIAGRGARRAASASSTSISARLAADLPTTTTSCSAISGGEGVRTVSRWPRRGRRRSLGRCPSHVVSSRFEAKGRLRDLLDAVRDCLPRTRCLRDAIDGDVEVSGTAHRPGRRARRRVRGAARDAATALRPPLRVRPRGGTHPPRRRGPASTARSCAAARASLRIARRRGAPCRRSRGTSTCSFAGVPIADLAAARRRVVGLRRAGRAALEGSFEQPARQVRGERRRGARSAASRSGRSRSAAPSTGSGSS